jgi:hypothetical protein
VNRSVEDLEKENANLREALRASVQQLRYCPICGGKAVWKNNELTIFHSDDDNAGPNCIVSGLCNEHVA